MMLAIFGNDFVSAFQADVSCGRYQPPGAARGFVIEAFQAYLIKKIVPKL